MASKRISSLLGLEKQTYSSWQARDFLGSSRLDREDKLGQSALGSPVYSWGITQAGIELSQATVAQYMVRESKSPSKSCRTFLENHSRGSVAVGFFTVPTSSLRVLLVFVVLAHHRRTSSWQ